METIIRPKGKPVNSRWTKFCDVNIRTVWSNERKWKIFTVNLGKEVPKPLTRKQPEVIPGCS